MPDSQESAGPVCIAKVNVTTELIRFILPVLDVPFGGDPCVTRDEEGEATKPKVDSDIDPREFLLTVEAWPEGKTVKLTVTYVACTRDECHEVRQDGGRAVSGGGFRARTPEEALKQLMEGDKNKDGKLTKDELPAFQQTRFAEFDLNKDGVLDKDEIEKMAHKLSERKRP